MRGVAIVCFFFSGASGLIFEVIWSRMFSLVFGATTLAISTVLTAFMGGLALGSYLTGRVADRIEDPLRAYALAEAGVGVTALLLPLVVGHFDALNAFLYQHFSDNYTVLAGIRFVASAGVMLIPTTLMGATLPLLSRLFVQDSTEHAQIGMRVGTLYAINTSGALTGTFLGGFVLLPYLGLSVTNRAAAGMNLLLALVVGLAYQIRKRLPARPPLDPEIQAILEEVRPTAAPPLEISAFARRACLVAFAFSGCVAMIYQVIWTRVLFMNIGSSVYSFTIVLTTFLIGLAGGAALVGRLAAATRNPVGLLAVLHLAVALMVGVSYLLIDKLPFVYIFLLRGETLEAQTVLWSQFLVALLIMLPATLAMGGIMPLTIRIYASGVQSVGKDVGNAYSINTIGAIVGSFMAGFVVIPLLQLQPGLFVAVCINLSLAAALGALSSWSRRVKLATAVAAVALVGVALVLPRWNLTHVSAGLFRMALARDVLETGRWTDPKIVYYRDGISTTVSVDQWSGTHYSMKNNGKVDASTGDDMPTQITVGLLPILVHPRAPELRPDVALIGYASGVTAGAILQYPVRRLDVVELEPAIIEASAFFEHINNRPLDDKRLRLLTDDGRNFLAAGSRLYDVIINEPSNPWITGVSNLFTRDYFEIGRRRLKPDGIFCTWAQMYEFSPRRIKSIYRSFAAVFPHVYAFSAEALSSDTFLIGSNKPLKLDIRRLRRAFQIPKVRAEMTRAKVTQPDDLIALTLLGPGEVQSYVTGAVINTDDNAWVEFRAPIDLLNHKRYDYYVSKVYGQTWMYSRLKHFISGYSSSEDYAGLVRSLLVFGKFREATSYYKKVRKDAGARSRRAGDLMGLLTPREVNEVEVALTDGGSALKPPKTPPDLAPKVANRIAREYFVVEQKVRAKAYRAALDMIEEWPDDTLEQMGDDFQLLWGYLVYKCRDFHTAVKVLEPLMERKGFSRRRPALLYYLGRAFYGNADFGKSIKALEQWIAQRGQAGKPVIPPATETGSEQIDVMPE